MEKKEAGQAYIGLYIDSAPLMRQADTLRGRLQGVFDEVGASAARYEGFSYECWGHSIVLDPYGTPISECDETEQILYAKINLARVDKVRAQLPTFLHLRRDVYAVAE